MDTDHLKELEDSNKIVWDVLYNTDWSEWWLVSIETFHILVLCFVILSHRANWHFLSAVVFLSLLAVMYFAQTLNTLAAENYTQFTAEQYFDREGLFMTIIVLFPCAVNCLLFILSWILQSWNLMVELKVKQSRIAASQRKDK